MSKFSRFNSITTMLGLATLLPMPSAASTTEDRITENFEKETTQRLSFVSNGDECALSHPRAKVCSAHGPKYAHRLSKLQRRELRTRDAQRAGKLAPNQSLSPWQRACLPESAWQALMPKCMRPA